MGIIYKYSIYFAWIVAIVATGGSLYMSEVLQYVPCELCWYQRIFMYPLVILLGIATFIDDRQVSKYAYPITVTGGLIAFYHILVQKVPYFSKASTCKMGIPCNQDYLNWFGFITIPVLAFVAFLLIVVFIWLSKKEITEK